MRLKYDENMPTDGIADLQRLGFDIDTVAMEQLEGADDERVFAAAQADARTVVTQDVGFTRVLSAGAGARGVILLRLTDPTRRAINRRMIVLATSGVLSKAPGHIVVCSDSKVRFRAIS